MQKQEVETQESHNKTLLRQEIFKLNSTIEKNENKFKLDISYQKKVRDDDILNIIENSSSSVNKSAIVSLALTKVKDKFKNEVETEYKDIKLMKGDAETEYRGKLINIESKYISACNTKCEDYRIDYEQKMNILNSETSKIKNDYNKLKNENKRAETELVEMYKVIFNIKNNMNNKTMISSEIEKIKPDKLPVL